MQQSPARPDRETFGVVPADRTTVKLGGLEESKAGKLSALATR